jgi:hypothetical protein
MMMTLTAEVIFLPFCIAEQRGDFRVKRAVV